MKYNRGDCFKRYKELVEQHTSEPNIDYERIMKEMQEDVSLKEIPHFEDQMYSDAYISVLQKTCNDFSEEITSNNIEISSIPSRFFDKRRVLNMKLKGYYSNVVSSKNLNQDINELKQRCINIYDSISQEHLDLLFESIRDIKQDLSTTFRLITMKNNEISSARVTVASIVISVFALIISVISIFST